MSYKDHSTRKLGLPAGKRPVKVAMAMKNGAAIRGHIRMDMSERLSDWLAKDGDFIVLLNAGIDDGPVQETLLVNKNQILWTTLSIEESDPGAAGF